MANPKLIVEIAGDPRKLERTLRQTETETQRWARKLSNVTGSSTLGNIGNKGLIAGALGAAGLAAVTKTINAASDAQQVLGQTRVALEDTGKSWERYGAQIEAAVAQQSRLGFDDEELLKTFSTFERATGDVTKSLELNALAVDVARARYIDLASASSIVLKASLGQAGALRRIGIDAQNGASGIQLLTLLQQKYGGSATAAADDAKTANDRLRVSLQNVEEQIGSGLLPVVSQLASALSDSAENAEALVKKLQGLNVPGLGNAKGVDLGGIVKAGIAATPGLQLIAGEGLLLKKLGLTDSDASSSGKAAGEKFGKTFGITFLQSAQTETNKAKGPTVEQKNTFFDNSISRSLDRAQDGSLKDQVAKLRAIESTLQERKKVTSDITRQLRLEDEIVGVQRQRKGIEETIAQNARDRAAAAKRAAAELKVERQEREKALQEARLAKIQSQQFKALGFAADGSEAVAGADNLRKQLASLTDRLGSSSVNLSSKLESQLEGVRKVLSGKFGTVTRESRDKIQELFDTIRGEFDKGAKGPLTKTHGLDTKKILEGLGLSPADEKELRSRLSGFNSAGRANGGGRTGRGGQPIVESHVTVQLDSHTVGQVVTRAQQKTRLRNPAQRRGPNRGKF